MHPLCMPLYVLQCPRASLPKGQQNDEFCIERTQPDGLFCYCKSSGSTDSASLVIS